jgi:hypothetical protein
MGAGPDEVFAEEIVAPCVPYVNVTRWALTDHPGTVRDVVSNAGVLLDTVVYSAFGQVVSQSDSTNAVQGGDDEPDDGGCTKPRHRISTG